MKFDLSLSLYLIMLLSFNAHSFDLLFDLPSDEQLNVIYGNDDRKLVRDLDGLYDLDYINAASAIMAQVPNWRITRSDKLSISIDVLDLKTGLKYCPDEKFTDLPLVSSCTAFLVGPDLLATAGHCVKDKFDCKKNSWVLDYDDSANFTPPRSEITFSKDNVYTCRELITSSENSKIDFALIRLDRVVEGRSPLKLRRSGKVDSDDSLYVIGHPLGLPKMISTNVIVRDNSLPFTFKTNADMFSGNSGSPLLSRHSGLVEGILIRGDKDFETDINSGCQRPATCRDNECRGETFQRTTILPLKHIPKI